MDREALRAKYRAERDKRIRPDGSAQYREAVGRWASLLDDPYVTPAPREPRFDHVDVALVGAGFAGLVTAARLKQAGVSNVRLIDRAGDVGGVWYWNRYPGAMCDTAAMIYLPLLEETGTVPTAKYVPGYEIFAHARRIAATFSLYDNALLSTSITSLTWDEASSRWVIETEQGDRFTAKYVSLGTGPIAQPHLPGIPGLDSFAGHAFHTSRWDYDYTGGSPRGDVMDRLRGKRVGVIGTGATGVQIVPPLAASGADVVVFQRTPSSIDERNNHGIDAEWFSRLEPGWQQKWLMNFTTLQTGGFADEDLVKDGWTDISQRIRDRVIAIAQRTGEFGPNIQDEAYEESDDEKMDEIRARVDAIVRDHATAEALKPWYRQLCKRPCFSDLYLQAFNEPNVRLIDTDGQGVERIDETGAWVNGEYYELDCIIYASGFAVGAEHSRPNALPIVGRGGVTLADAWANGMETFHGMHVRGFPNLFISAIAQAANLVSNIPHNYVSSGTTTAAIVAHAEAIGASTVETSDAAQAEWVSMHENPRRSIFGNRDCTPGYYNNEGGEIGRRERLNSGGYPAGALAFFNMIDEWRASGEFTGLEFGR